MRVHSYLPAISYQKYPVEVRAPKSEEWWVMSFHCTILPVQPDVMAVGTTEAEWAAQGVFKSLLSPHLVLILPTRLALGELKTDWDGCHVLFCVSEGTQRCHMTIYHSTTQWEQVDTGR